MEYKFRPNETTYEVRDFDMNADDTLFGVAPDYVDGKPSFVIVDIGNGGGCAVRFANADELGRFGSLLVAFALMTRMKESDQPAKGDLH